MRSLHTGGWQALGAFIAALTAAGVGILFQLRIASKNREQLTKLSSDALEVQRLVSHRASASFIADKRQKWIDELRSEVATYLALSEEITAAYAVMFAKAGERLDEVSVLREGDLKGADRVREEFDKLNGPRIRQHHESLIRTTLRLNKGEVEHRNLLSELQTIRELLQACEKESRGDTYNETDAFKHVADHVVVAADLTSVILKSEWTRVKQEVAFPERLLASIPHPSSPQP
jgi:hypothetical protein